MDTYVLYDLLVGLLQNIINIFLKSIIWLRNMQNRFKRHWPRNTIILWLIKLKEKKISITPFKTYALFLRHSTLPIFPELEYCLICVKFPPKIAPHTLHTVKKNSNYFQYCKFHEGSNIPKSFLWKNILYELNLYMFQITLPAFYCRIL